MTFTCPVLIMIRAGHCIVSSFYFEWHNMRSKILRIQACWCMCYLFCVFAHFEVIIVIFQLSLFSRSCSAIDFETTVVYWQYPPFRSRRSRQTLWRQFCWNNQVRFNKYLLGKNYCYVWICFISWIYSTLPENKQMLALSATYTESMAQHLTSYMRSPTFVRLNSSDPALLGMSRFQSYRATKKAFSSRASRRELL